MCLHCVNATTHYGTILCMWDWAQRWSGQKALLYLKAVQSTHKDWGKKASFHHYTHTHMHNHTHIQIHVSVKHEAWNKTKGIVSLHFSSVSIFSPFGSVLLACFVISLQTIFKSAALSLIPLPSSLLLFSISSSYHTCSLFQSWAASKLVCAVCVPHQGLCTHINTSVHSGTYALTRIYTHAIFYPHTQREHGIWACFFAPWGGSQCSELAFHTITLVLSSQCGPVQHGTAWHGTLQLSTACNMPT